MDIGTEIMCNARNSWKRKRNRISHEKQVADAGSSEKPAQVLLYKKKSNMLLLDLNLKPYERSPHLYR